MLMITVHDLDLDMLLSILYPLLMFFTSFTILFLIGINFD